MKIALIGFGTVGQSLVKVLHENKVHLKARYGFDAELVAVSDILRGGVMDPESLDLAQLLRLVKETGKIDDYSGGVKGLDSLETIKRCGADTVVEAAWTNLETGEPGITHIREALKNGRHVVTSNKGPIALAYHELRQLAEERGVELRFECTVMSGTPAIAVGLEDLAGHRVSEIRGIVNGTTNYILTRMEKGIDYSDALREAQRLGFAEADPSADVEGWDAVGKIVILANTVMGAHLKPGDVRREGITEISSEDVEAALREGKRIKLIARVWDEEGKVQASVGPEKISLNDPLAHVAGSLNALTYVTDGLREVTLMGPGAGGVETGHGVLSDLLAIHRDVGIGVGRQ
ncbi:MAG: homoserine dehydrogenase [Candidatus Bathyarchaeota archaeon]